MYKYRVESLLQLTIHVIIIHHIYQDFRWSFCPSCLRISSLMFSMLMLTFFNPFSASSTLLSSGNLKVIVIIFNNANAIQCIIASYKNNILYKLLWLCSCDLKMG